MITNIIDWFLTAVALILIYIVGYIIYQYTVHDRYYVEEVRVSNKLTTWYNSNTDDILSIKHKQQFNNFSIMEVEIRKGQNLKETLTLIPTYQIR
jgi:hypothetical protein